MTKTQIAILERALDTLSADNASPYVADRIKDERVALWLDTWVRPLISDVIENGKGNVDADDIKFWVGK